MKFRTRFTCGKSRAAAIGGPTLAQSQFLDSCDVKKIIARCKTVGIPLSTVQRTNGFFADLTMAPDDLRSALDISIKARDSFEQLPAKVKERFGFDPSKLLDFVQDSNNRDEAIRLGLIDPPAVDTTLNPSPSTVEKDIPSAVPPASTASDAKTSVVAKSAE